MGSTRFREMSPARRVLAGVLIAVSLVIVGLAQRDLYSRDDSEVRGNKWVWRAASINALGALAYLGFGRSK